MLTTKPAKRRRKSSAKKPKAKLTPSSIAARKKLELAVKNVNQRLTSLVNLHYFAA